MMEKLQIRSIVEKRLSVLATKWAVYKEWSKQREEGDEEGEVRPSGRRGAGVGWEGGGGGG